MKNPLKADPTRTTGLRRQFERDMIRRFRLLKKDIQKLVVEEDAFNLNPKLPLIIMASKQFAFQTSENKLSSFNTWFKHRVDERVLTVDHVGKPWTSKYVDSAYKKGSIRAYTDTHKKSLMKSQDFYEGSKDQFLKSAFMHPERMSKLRLLGTRVFEQLKGVTAEMGSKMNVLLAEGMAHGKGPVDISRQMANTITGLTNKRARVIARTEVIYAHAEGQLDSFEDLGVKELELMAEWSTAGDDRVCSQCAEMEGMVMTIEEARGMIPLHPNCRCAWIPANVGEKKRREAKLLKKYGKKGKVVSAPASSLPLPKLKPVVKPKVKKPPKPKAKPELEPLTKKQEALVKKVAPKGLVRADARNVTEICARSNKVKTAKDLMAADSAVNDYGLHGWGINKDLRKGKWEKGFGYIDDFIKHGEKLQTDKVFRGMSLTKKEFAEYTPGKILKNLGYTSTSPQRKLAEDFVGTGMKARDVLLEISGVKGRATYLSGSAGALSRAHGGKEYLLARGTRLKVISVEKDVLKRLRGPDRPIFKIKVELIK